MNEYYDSSGYPQTGASGSSASMRAELDLVEAGFNKLPVLTGKNNKLVKVNSAATALEGSAVISDDGTNATVSGDLTVAGGNIGIDADSLHTLPNVAADVFTLNSATQTLANKSISGSFNTITDIGTSALSNDSVTYAKLQNVSATDKLLGRSTAGAGDVEEISCTSAGRALLDDATAADQRTTLGLGNLATQNGTFSGASSGTNTGDQNIFSTIAVSGQSDVIADSSSDALTLVAGSNITISTNAATDSITISATSGLTDGDKGDITVSGSGAVLTIDNDSVTNAKLANAYINDLTEVTFDSIADFVAIADTSDSGSKKKAKVIISNKIQPITASVAANALTITLNPTTLDFRDATLTSGTVNTRNVSAAISVVVSSGSTLGTVNAVQNRLAVLAIDNAGTVELAVVNMSGGVNLDETGVISTTAEGGAGASDSATVIYSTASRTNVPYRVVGFVQSTQATAGTWATAPSTIQGYGGQAFAAMSSIGYGQTPQNVTGSRTLSTTYYNTTGKPMLVEVFGTSTAAATISITVNGVGAGINQINGNNLFASAVAIVPPNASYACTFSAGTPTLNTWIELR